MHQAACDVVNFGDGAVIRCTWLWGPSHGLMGLTSSLMKSHSSQRCRSLHGRRNCLLDVHSCSGLFVSVRRSRYEPRPSNG